MSEPLFKRSEQALFANVGDDIVALHLEKGLCFGMVDVSAEVWALIEEPASLDQICNGLMQKYEIDQETCRAEVARFIDELQSEGLVESAAGPSGSES